MPGRTSCYAPSLIGALLKAPDVETERRLQGDVSRDIHADVKVDLAYGMSLTTQSYSTVASRLLRAWDVAWTGNTQNSYPQSRKASSPGGVRSISSI